MSVLDKELRYLFVGGGRLATVGLRPEDLVGKTLDEVWPPELIETITPYYKQVLAGEEVSFQVMLLNQWHSVTATPVLDETGQVETIVAINHNIHAAKLAEAELEETRRKILTNWECTTDGVYTLNTQWRFTYINAQAERIMNRKREGLLGHSLWEEFPQALEEGYKLNFEQAFNEQIALHYETFYAPFDMWLDVNVYPNVEGLTVYLHDITQRKRAEEEQARLAKIVESSSDAIISINIEGIINTWNAGATKIYGYTADEVIGRHLSLLVPPLTPADQLNLIEAMRREETIESLEVKRLSKSGSLLDLSISCWPLRNEAGEIIGASSIARDITAQKEAAARQAELAEQVRRQHQRLDEILSNVPGIVWETCINAETQEHNVVYVSKYVETMLGYTPQEWMNSTDWWTRVVHPDDYQKSLERSELTYQSGRSAVERYRLLAKDGHIVWVQTYYAPIYSERGEKTGLRGVTMDITAQMEAQEEQRRLVTLLESTPDLVSWTDTEGNLKYINPAGRALLGLHSDESLEGRIIADFVPAWVAKLVVQVGFPIASCDGSWAGETAILDKNGREIPISQVITVHKDADGRDIYFSTIARDVSETRRVRAMLERANEELEERVASRTADLEGAMREAETARREAETAREDAEKANRAKSEFLSRMSHELRTPMNAILGFGQLMEMRNLNPKDMKSVEQILKAGRHLLQLINEVLEISRIEEGRLQLAIEPIDVLSQFREVCSLMQPLAEQRHIKLTFEIDSEPVEDVSTLEPRYVLADRQRLHQVMLNLLSNAIKYNRDEGEVVLSLKRAGRSDPPDLRIEVRDSGPGIAPQDREKIFLPFERLEAETSEIEGTGIGLTLTRRLVEMMEGSIGLISELDRGSTFWVELPGAAAPEGSVIHSPTAVSAPLAPLAALHRDVTILYIEDNPSNLSLMQDLFSELPRIRLIAAMDGRRGLELAHHHQPDLILLDLNLPRIPGDEVLQHLVTNPRTKHIPVVMVTADATRPQINRLLQAGARRYITKPLEIEQLVRVIEELLKE